MASSFANLKQIREKLLGYQRLEAVARLAHISADRMRAIEDEGSAPSVYEIEELARVYGIDPDILADEPIRLAPGDGVEILTLREEFRDVGDGVRARIVAAANAARDLTWLRRKIGGTDLRAKFLEERPRLRPAQKGEQPHRQGTRLAADLRSQLTLGTAPVPSVRDLVTVSFPSMTLLYADLTEEGPAGISFVDPIRGPVIVLNLAGKNKNAAVRRFSLAHELCHLLADWQGSEPLAVVSGYFTESRLAMEQRANAFAVRFLCPPSRFVRIAKRLPKADAVREVAAFGLPYSAVRLYLKNETGRLLPPTPPSEWTTASTDARWIEPERPLGIDGFPIDVVPPERRTAVAEAAARAYSGRLISRDRFADLLGVTPAAPVEQVLDFVGLDRPIERSSAT